MKNLLKLIPLMMGIVLILGSCSKGDSSAITGWKYNDPKWGGFEKQVDYEGQQTGPNLVLIPGGTFVMGFTEQDVTFDWNAIPRRVTVSSFYMDETEIANIDYREYLYWVRRVWGETYPEVYRNALPDTLVWREELAFNEPLVETYFRHPSYDDYPVVGVSWLQANEFCKWRTDRVNEAILIEKGILNVNLEQVDDDNFNTGAYLVGQYEGNVRKNLPDLQTGGDRPVRYEDGILLPEYRLPTEAEWEYAALSLIGTQANPKDELYSDRRLYPWSDNTVRYQVRDRYQGDIMANFKRGRGDYMGLAGNLNDNACPTAPVRSYLPNDFGLYNMAGNVNEWVLDLYRPLTSSTLSDVENQDMNPYRGNNFQHLIVDEDSNPVEKDSLGRLRYRYLEEGEAADRENYKRGDVYNFNDGDEMSEAGYDYGNHTLISDKSRVFKGGSWADRAYWLSPGTRRYKDEFRGDRTIGFRCAMIRVGSPTGNGETSGNIFSAGRKGGASGRRY